MTNMRAALSEIKRNLMKRPTLFTSASSSDPNIPLMVLHNVVMSQIVTYWLSLYDLNKIMSDVEVIFRFMGKPSLFVL